LLGVYSGLFRQSDNRTKSDIEEPENVQELDDSTLFQEKWGWMIPLYELCGNDLNLRNDWLNSNVIEFLNQLSFLKEKNNMENRPKMGRQY